MPLNRALKNQFLYIPVAILIGCGLISLSILISGGVIRTKGDSSNIQASPSSRADESQDPNTLPVKISVDDDPVLGDKNAPITLIEFSDYECPFCKRYYEQTFPQLKAEYIDKKKIKLVYRDYPLSFHDPNATDQAMAANCAREQGGDASYFKFHDEIYKRTNSNKGLSRDVLPKIAADLNLNTDNFVNCLDSGKYKDEVYKDLTDGGKVGASGTPTFFIGKVNSEGYIDPTIVTDISDASAPHSLYKFSDKDGNVIGYKIIGAHPYSTFKSQIDSLLN